MLFITFLFLCVGIYAQHKYSNYYDTFTGKFISEEKYKQHVKDNNSFWCVGQLLKSCNPHEGRRVDGTCNNLQYPTRGAIHTPTYRMLPAVYDEGFNPRKAKDGCELPLVRPARMNILHDGRMPDQQFTQLLSYGLISLTNDIISVADTVAFVLWKPYCCGPKGKTDRECVPNAIPSDDPVHQFSGIRCQNMTRPRSFQSSGCVRNDTVPVRIISSTPVYDLSHIYGNTLASLNNKGRLFVGGLLKFELENGKIWPPSAKTPVTLCRLNQGPRETRCHSGPEDSANSLLPANLIFIWLWRHHNVIANELGRVNPCWGDEKLFQTAKDINIAFNMQMLYYELLPDLMGYDNLVNDKVISISPGFRDIYDDKVYPQLALEYPFALRWTHLLQDAKVKMYDADGCHLKDIKMVNFTLRTGYLVDTIQYMTQGAIRQASANIKDYAVDPDMGQISLGPHQKIYDVTTSDLAKNRYFGFAPYIKYKELCCGKRYKTFADLVDSIDAEYVEQLAEVYKHIEDIDLMAGMWLERRTYGFVPPTFYCLMVEQLRRNVVSDRHWYERPNRPHAFTLEQLLEIRKATVARLLCDVGDTVTKIQPRAFLRPGPYNQMCSCEFIPKIDYKAWKDYTCEIEEKPTKWKSI